jgi:putative acetyltransferase
MIRIVTLGSPPDDTLLAEARVLMGEYAAMPHSRALWVTSAADIATLPHPFTPPRGGLLLAFDEGDAVGCGGWIPTAEPSVTELKRVYVRPVARGRGVGEALMLELMARAGTLGFRRAILDTARDLVAAQALYRRLGFAEIAQFRPENGDVTVCFGRELGSGRASDLTWS